MNEENTHKHMRYLKEVRLFAKEHLNDQTKMNSFSRDLWDAISEFGLFGIAISEEYGGVGEDYFTAALVMEELGKSCINNGLIFAVTNHMWTALNIISLCGTKEQKDRYLVPMVKGRYIGAFALTEPDAGSDALAMTTYAESRDGYFILNGRKTFVSNGPIADVFVVIATTNQNPKAYTAFIVDRNTDGLIIGDSIQKMGLESCPTSDIVFEQCKVSNRNVLGQIGNGNIIMNEIIMWERCFEFAPHIGTMHRIMSKCISYVNERKQFGKYIKDYQSVTNKIVNMKVVIELSKNMLYRIAYLKEQRKNAYMETNIFKLYVSEKYIEVCQDAMQIFGGYGYTKEYGIERELRDAMASTVYSGTSEVIQNTVFQLLNFGG